MAVSDARTQLNQKLDQLPPGILKVVTEFVDFLLYRHSQASKSSKNIVLEKDSSAEPNREFKNRSQQIDDKNIRRAQGSLLDNTETWVGDHGYRHHGYTKAFRIMLMRKAFVFGEAIYVAH